MAPPPLLSLIAGELLAAHRIVMANAFAKAIYPSLSIVGDGRAILGITTKPIRAGGPASIQDYGEMTDATWHWTPRAPIYAGSGGMLSSSVPAGLWTRQVAVAITATKIWISIRDSVVL